MIFGAGKIAECITYFFTKDNLFEISAYCVDAEYLKNDSFLNKPMISSQDIASKFPPEQYGMFVAMGYQGLNSVRTSKVALAKEWGYELVSYTKKDAAGCLVCGENSIVMDDAVVQPCAKIGSNVFIWGGSLVGHHAQIEDNCWITGSAVIGGGAQIGENSFLGLNSSVGNEVEVGGDCMIGAGVLVTKNLPSGTVLVEKDTDYHRLNSKQFIRLSSCFKA